MQKRFRMDADSLVVESFEAGAAEAPRYGTTRVPGTCDSACVSRDIPPCRAEGALR